MAKKQKKITESNIPDSNIENQLNNYLKSYEQLKITIIKVEGAIEVLQNILKEEESKK